MKPVRFNIAGLMTVVAVSALGMVAMRNVRPTNFALLFFVALALNLGAFVAALALKDRVRIFMIGYALLGCSYLATVAIAPRLDLFVDDNLVALEVIPKVVRVRGPLLTPYHLAAHALFDIASGLAGGLVALGLTRGIDVQEAPTTSTTGQP